MIHDFTSVSTHYDKLDSLIAVFIYETNGKEKSCFGAAGVAAWCESIVHRLTCWAKGCTRNRRWVERQAGGRVRWLAMNRISARIEREGEGD